MSDKFSLERVGLLWDFFQPRIVKQLGWTILYMVITYFLIAMCCEINSYALYSICLMLPLQPLYFGPIIFATYHNRELFVQIPATSTEKTSFILGYVLIVIPLIMYITWLSSEAIGAIIGLPSNIMHYFDYRLRNYGVSNIFTIASLFIDAIPVIVSLYVILSSSIHRVLRGVLSVFAAIFALGIINFFVGIWLFYDTILSIKETNTLPSETYF